MTGIAKHVARKPLLAPAPGDAPGRLRNRQLRARFEPRPAEARWPSTALSLQETLERLAAPPFVPASDATLAGRRRGVNKMLTWLASFPGDTWQDRWLVSGVEEHPAASWVQLPLDWLRNRGQSSSCDPTDLPSGLLMLICGDVVRPGLPWMLTQTHRYLAPVMAHTRDPDGFTRLHQLAQAGPASSRQDAKIAATRIATLLACKGGTINDITVGDCVELVDTQRRVHAAAGRRRWTSTSGCAPWGSSPTTRRPRSARSDWPAGN